MRGGLISFFFFLPTFLISLLTFLVISLLVLWCLCLPSALCPPLQLLLLLACAPSVSVALPRAPAPFLPPLLLRLVLLYLLRLRPLVALLPHSGVPLCSSFSSGLPLRPPPVPVLPSSSVLPLASSVPPAGSLGFVAASADPVAAPAVPVAASAAPSALFLPFDIASAPQGLAPSLSGSSFAPVCSASLPSGFAPAPLLSASAPLPHLAPLVPPPSEAAHGSPFRPFAPGPSASTGPPPSAFAFAADDAFDPGLADPEASVPLSVPDSVHAEIRHMYAYLVDLFPQAAGSPSDPPPPWALFEDFFVASMSPHQPVFLAWFERVRTALAEADAQLASVLASGRADTSILP